MLFPKGSCYLKLNTNEKNESAILDQILSGNSDAIIPINGAPVPASSMEVTYLSYGANIVFVVISPRGAAGPVIPTEVE